MDRRIEEYLAYLDAVRGLSPRTLRSYREDFGRFEAFMKASGFHEGPHGVPASDEGTKSDIDSTSASDIRAFAPRWSSRARQARA